MIFIIENGSQYTHVIWRSVRDLGFEAKIVANKERMDTLADAQAFIMGGGPGSSYLDKYPLCEEIVHKAAEGKLGKPVLGICLGQQIIGHLLGGKVEKGPSAEYGLAQVEVDKEGVLLRGLPAKFNVWVSHFDEVVKEPVGFLVLAHSDTCKIEAMENVKRELFATQFHPEVWHTEHGEEILKNFLSRCK
jgi:GMP synthase (glutamine-hydrolysing)